MIKRERESETKRKRERERERKRKREKFNQPMKAMHFLKSVIDGWTSSDEALIFPWICTPSEGEISDPSILQSIS